jgi:ribosomal protein S12 methylthiotransferase
MLGVASSGGYTLTAEADDAEVIVVNTCGFIGEAKKESIETIFELAEMKRSGRCKKLVVAGCLSQRYPTELAKQMAEVDHFLGSSDMLKLGDILRGRAERMLVGNRTCSFCTIPQFRGKQRSRPADDVVREVEQLAQNGVLEINLISQDTVSYGRDLPKTERSALAELVERVADVPGIRWVRVFYLYPENVDEHLLHLLSEHPRVVPYVDMPLQHAADAMLKRMKRGYGQDRQKRVVARMREGIKNLTFRTAFIVGHPGETDQEFEELCEFVRWAQFEHVGVFRYSDEETSGSAKLEGKVTAQVAQRRYRKLMSLQRGIARAKNKQLIGKTLEVLVEGTSEEHEFVMKGRHRGQAPDIDGQVYLSEGEAAAGQIRQVRIDQASDYDLVGALMDEAPSAPKKRRVGLRVLPA